MNDESKSLAIMNLQAILDLDNVDKLVSLLEQNNWDESVSPDLFMVKLGRSILVFRRANPQ